MIGIKFQGKSIVWSDYDHSVGPWRGRNDYGQCCFFVPHLNMHPLDPEMGTIEMFHERKPTAKHRDSLTVLLDAEQFNYAFIDEEYESPGAGFNLVLLDHRDKPMVSLSSQIINTGTETQVYVKPSLTRTTDEAIAKFSPEERGCFADGEANLTYLPYDKGYRYVMNNCLSDQGIRGKNDANYSIKTLYTFFFLIEIIWTCRCYPSLINVAMLGELRKLIPSCSGEKLICANKIQSLLGLENKILEAVENPDQIGNITKPKCMLSVID